MCPAISSLLNVVDHDFAILIVDGLWTMPKGIGGSKGNISIFWPPQIYHLQTCHRVNQDGTLY